MDNNKLDYESTSEDNTSIEENEIFIKRVKKASSKYLNPNLKPKIITNTNTNQTNTNQTNTNQTNTNQTNTNQIKVSNPTLLLIKCRK